MDGSSGAGRAAPVVALLGALAACDGEEPAVAADASPTADRADVIEERAPEDVAGDASAPEDVAEDVADDAPEHADPCAADAIVDLSALPRADGRVVYRGTTASGPSMQPWALPAQCLPSGRAIRVVAHRYTARAAVSIAVTTASPHSGAHDTVLWFARNCQAPPAATACSDDLGASPQSRITISGFPAGATGYLFVATAAAQDGKPGRPYELTVDEYPTPAEGAACTVGVAVCGAGHGCVRLPDEGYGACRADGSVVGARCRSVEPRCDDGMECVGTTCFRRASPGGRCRLGEVLCAAGERCVAADPARPRDGDCVAGGTLGGACSATVACGEGLRCSVAAPSGTASGFCQRHAAPGEACSGPDASPTVVCDAPAECVPAGPGATAFTCRAPGEAAGARCREGGGCDAGLACSAAGGLGYCRAVTADACVPLQAASDCGAGRVCAATDLYAGRCVAWAREGAADNGGEGRAEAPRALPFAVRGALLPQGDVDCYGAELAREGTLAFRVHDGTGRCLAGASPTVTVYGAHEIQPVVSAPGCGGLLGGAGYRLPAGRYAVCVQHGAGAPVLDYFLTASVR